MSEVETRRIVCAANRLLFNPESEIGSFVICGPRHHDTTMHKNEDHLDEYVLSQVIGREQGFIDQFGTFHTREEAYHIAYAQKQIIRSVGGDLGRLYSENLY